MDALFGVIGFIGLIITTLFLTAKKGNKKTLQKLLLLFSAFFIIGLALPNSEPKEEIKKEEPENEVKKEESENEVEKEEIEIEKPKKEIIKDNKKNIVDSIGKEVFGEDYIGSTLNWDYDKAVFKEDGSIDENNTAINSLNIEINLGDNLTENMMIKNFLLKTTKFLDESKSINYNTVFIGAKSDFKDKYGNIDNQYAAKITIDKHEVNKINFNNFNFKDLPAIAETFYVHPGIKYNLK